jgi:hypothetical protein
MDGVAYDATVRAATGFVGATWIKAAGGGVAAWVAVKPGIKILEWGVKQGNQDNRNHEDHPYHH